MHGTPQVRAIDREHLEILAVDISDPAGDIRGLPIPGIGYRISKGREPRLAYRKFFQCSETEPGLVAGLAPANNRRHDITQDRYGQDCANDSVEQQSKLGQQSASRGCS
jgi:hypothetical protein